MYLSKFIILLATEINNSLKKDIMKIKRIITAGIIIAVISLNLLFASINKTYSGISLSNIEALSSHEETKNYCLGNGSVDCPVSTIKVEIVIYYK